MSLNSLQIGEHLLGPIFYRFCYQLYLHQLAYEEDNSVALFLSRGGFRLRHYYNQFLAANNIPPPCPQNDLYVSRMGVYKAGVSKRIDWIINDLVKEYAWYDSLSAMKLILSTNIYETWYNTLTAEKINSLKQNRFSKKFFLECIEPSSQNNNIILRFFEEQHVLLKSHIEHVSHNRDHLLLIDTGWSGSIVGALKAVFPEFDMTAHFFGRYNYGGTGKPWYPHLIGVEVEGYDFLPKIPVTSIFLHRHLIEGICEVEWASVEGYIHNSTTNESEPSHGFMPEDRRAASETKNPLAAGISRYITRNKMKDNPHMIQEKANKAAEKLARIICYPSSKITHEATVETRSADFGKEIDVPVLLKPRPFFQLKRKFRQIRESLWPQGQIALEFPYAHRLIQFLYLRRELLEKLRSKFRKYFPHFS